MHTPGLEFPENMAIHEDRLKIGFGVTYLLSPFLLNQ